MGLVGLRMRRFSNQDRALRLILRIQSCRDPVFGIGGNWEVREEF